ncbi:MAG: hypothetical protein ABL868_10900 [Sulfuriferula sp.]
MDEPIIDKMDALIGRYQSNPFAPAAIPPEPLVMPNCETLIMPDYASKPSFPVLTDIVQLGDAVFNDTAPLPPEPAAAAAISDETTQEIAHNILQTVNAQLQTQVTSLIAPKLQQAMDDTFALLLPQLTINIEHIVQQTLTNEFARYGITLKQADDSV